MLTESLCISYTVRWWKLKYTLQAGASMSLYMKLRLNVVRILTCPCPGKRHCAFISFHVWLSLLISLSFLFSLLLKALSSSCFSFLFLMSISFTLVFVGFHHSSLSLCFVSLSDVMRCIRIFYWDIIWRNFLCKGVNGPCLYQVIHTSTKRQSSRVCHEFCRIYFIVNSINFVYHVSPDRKFSLPAMCIKSF